MAGTIFRLFLVINDYTSADGAPLGLLTLWFRAPVQALKFGLCSSIAETISAGVMWDPKRCVLVTSGGLSDQLPRVASRGTSLDGSSYPSPHMTSGALRPRTKAQTSKYLLRFNQSCQHASYRACDNSHECSAAAELPMLLIDRQVLLEDLDHLKAALWVCWPKFKTSWCITGGT